jgi:hypothetical protein
MVLESAAGKRHRAKEQVRRARLRDFLNSLESETLDDDEDDADNSEPLAHDNSEQVSEIVPFATRTLVQSRSTRVPKSKTSRASTASGTVADADALTAPTSGYAVDTTLEEELGAAVAPGLLANRPPTPSWSLSQLAKLNYRYAWLAQRGFQEGWLYFTSAPAAPSKRPPLHLCDVCGYQACYTCPRCGAFTCTLGCTQTHTETRCLRSWQP